MFLSGFFIFLIFIPKFHANDNHVKKCGQYSIESLQSQLFYTPYKNTEPLKIKIGSQPTDEQKIYIGYYLSDAKGTICCVAVKFMNKRAENKFYRKSVQIMERIQNKLAKDQRKYLIEMIDAGQTKPYGQQAIIMEMGLISFHERLYDRTGIQFDNDRHLLNAAKSLAQPLAQFHHIAIHMDVNPGNYLYVREEDGHLVLKLIDFEGAQYISSADQNECVTVGEHAFTPEYTGPEYYDERGREISTKFDIWSVGMIVLEILVDHLRAELKETPLAETDRKSMLRNIGNLYLGFTRNRFGAMGADKEAPIKYSVYDQTWVEQHVDAIGAVLQLWHKFPQTALLVTNLLHFERNKRLTAQGIINYVDGLCYIGEYLPIKKAKRLRIFNSFNLGNLLKALRITKISNKINYLKENKNELNKKYKLMKRTLKKVIREQQKAISDRIKPSGETATPPIDRRECATE